jgi:DNA-binding NarL/FixJ family response regulator
MIRQSPYQILIVDDHPIVREGLTLRLSTQKDFAVCGTAATEDEAVAMVEEKLPDLVLMDISLKQGNGVEAIKRIKVLFPAMKLLVVSGFQETLYAERVLRAGAMGYLNKQESNDKILDAIRTVLSGNTYVSNEFTQRLVSHALGKSKPEKSSIENLTNRELEVFRMIGEGLTSGVIAEKLFLSAHTIDTHRENIKRKLSLKNSGELVRAAVQWSLEVG